MLRPLLLLSNDDGHFAPGLHAFRRALSTWADVVVCAPETNQSATSHSLSLHRPLRLRKHADNLFGLDGTPADCVYVALNARDRVVPRRPDLVVSGMNHGMNLGSDVFYSGTVAAAREGAMRGIPAVAVSAHAEADLERAASLGASIARTLLDQVRARASELGAEQHAEPGARRPTNRTTLLNVNIPRGEAWPLRATRLGVRLYEDEGNNEYLWIGGTNVRHGEMSGSDTEAFDEGSASVTPLSLDLCASNHLDRATEVVATVLEMK